MEPKNLEVDEATDFIIDILKRAEKPLTTREVQMAAEEHRVRCPDTTTVFLNKLRRKGTIEGMLSKERRGWIWWIEC